MSSDPYRWKFANTARGWMTGCVQIDLRQRMRRVQPGSVSDLTSLRFTFNGGSQWSMSAKVELEERHIGWLLFQMSWWFRQPLTHYTAMALCDGTLIEMQVAKATIDTLEVFVNRNQERFSIHGLDKPLSLGPEATLHWSHGELPRAFSSPWLAGTDWPLEESIAFKMGRDELREHETFPLLALGMLDWIEWQRLELLSG